MVAKKKTAKKSVAKKEAAPKTVAKRKTTRKAAKKTAVAKAPKAPAQRIGGWWYGSFSGSGILVAVAALFGILAFFIGWLQFDLGFGLNSSFNGIEFITVDKAIKTEMLKDSWQLMIPIFTLVLSILAFIAIIIPAFGVRGGKLGIDAFVVIVGIAIFILSICFLFGNVGGLEELGLSWNDKFINHLNVGFYTTIVASVIMILGGLRDATKSY